MANWMMAFLPLWSIIQKDEEASQAGLVNQVHYTVLKKMVMLRINLNEFKIMVS